MHLISWQVLYNRREQGYNISAIVDLYTYETFNHGDENARSITRMIVSHVSSHSQNTRICGLWTKGVCSSEWGLYTYETFNHGDENARSITRMIVSHVSSHSQNTRICGLWTKGVCHSDWGLYTYETFNNGDENGGSVTSVIVSYVSSHSLNTRICGLWTKMWKVYAVLTYTFFFSNKKLGKIRDKI